MLQKLIRHNGKYILKVNKKTCQNNRSSGLKTVITCCGLSFDRKISEKNHLKVPIID